MGFWTDVKKAWQTSQKEREWKKKFDNVKVSPKTQSEKDAFTARGEPWVTILRMDIDPENLTDGAFELDWNPIFVARLVKAGYRGKDDKAIVDLWFKTICSNVLAENYENEMADPEKRRIIQRKRIDKSTTEVS
jgi:hypothetical protein